MRDLIISLLLIFLICFISESFAQDLGRIGEQKGISLSGNINLSFSTYNVSGINSRRSPFSWRISGSPMISLYGIKVPFRLALADQAYSFTHPFSRYGMSPYYKWAKLHLGWSSMRFSPYTFSGRSFYGGGLELTPGKFNLASFYGKIDDIYAQIDTIIYGAKQIQTYDRMAYGVKIGIGSRSNFFNLQLVRAKDEINSPVDIEKLVQMGFLPEDNLIIGSSFGFRLFRRLKIKVNSAASIFTDDLNAEAIDVTDERLIKIFSFYQPHRKSYISYAGDAVLTLNLGKHNFQAIYKRVEPRFKTLTTNYLAQDYENYRLQINTKVLNKMSIQLSGGLQRDNLYKLKRFSSTRIISSINIQYNPNTKWFFNGRYANFNREMHEAIVSINDTLRRVSISGQYGLNMRYIIGDKKRKSSLGLSINKNNIQNISQLESATNEIDNFSGIITGSYKIARWNINLIPSINYSRYQYGLILEERYGGTIGITSSIKKTLRISFRTTYNLNDHNQLRNGNIFRNSFSTTYTMKKRHRISVRLGHIKRHSILRSSFTEFRSSMSYGYKF